MTGLIVTTKHLFTIPGYSRRRGFCRDGARMFCAANGIDWRDFVRNGVSADRLLKTGDAMALALVEWARECDSEGTDGR